MGKAMVLWIFYPKCNPVFDQSISEISSNGSQKNGMFQSRNVVIKTVSGG